VLTNLWQNRAKLPNWKITRTEVKIILLSYSIRGSMKYGDLNRFRKHNNTNILKHLFLSVLYLTPFLLYLEDMVTNYCILLL
jgi:hypothetical protein